MELKELWDAGTFALKEMMMISYALWKKYIKLTHKEVISHQLCIIFHMQNRLIDFDAYLAQNVVH
jgi:hypothetical protein